MAGRLRVSVTGSFTSSVGSAVAARLAASAAAAMGRYPVSAAACAGGNVEPRRGASSAGSTGRMVRRADTRTVSG
ncbi:hypothetical protein [Tsukamurella soli]|uniref:hypothetical protein n=1 Tax=Tsukamurella soli TaxID=644556 RepID=UPI00360E8604